MKIKLTTRNLFELKEQFITETPNYTYIAEPIGIFYYRLKRYGKKETEKQAEICVMPDIYRPYFKKWKWEFDKKIDIEKS